MIVEVASYHPHITCDRSVAPPSRSCFHIIGDMEASKENQVFGKRGDPGVQVVLPIILTACKALSTVLHSYRYS